MKHPNHSDANGVYTDEASEAEGLEPLTLEDARNYMRGQLEDQRYAKNPNSLYSGNRWYRHYYRHIRRNTHH